MQNNLAKNGKIAKILHFWCKNLSQKQAIM